MLIDWQTMRQNRKKLRQLKKIVVFTNGCFDILHRGHVEYLQKAKRLGDILVVGLNSDASIRRIKGEKRPLVPQEDRAIVLSALQCVDYVVIFEEETPQLLIEAIIPDILVKGGDWAIDSIVGREVVWQHGGEVKAIPLTPGRSSTNIIDRILERYGCS